MELAYEKRKHSTLSAVVLQWGRARKRYERQGLLAEAERRVELDQHYVESFARRVRELFPHCPVGREQVIAEHARLKYSGRVGRSAEANSSHNSGQ